MFSLALLTLSAAAPTLSDPATDPSQWKVLDANNVPLPSSYDPQMPGYIMLGDMKGTLGTTYGNNAPTPYHLDSDYNYAYGPIFSYDANGQFLFSGSVSDGLYSNLNGTGTSIDINTHAYNCAGSYNTAFYTDKDGHLSPLIGSVGGGLQSQLQAFFVYSPTTDNSPAPTPAAPAPAFIHVLLTDLLHVRAQTYYGMAPAGGLSALAIAAEGAPFNNLLMVSASEPGDYTAQDVYFRHLVRAAVDPVTGIAEVYLNGSTGVVSSDSVPVAVLDPTGRYMTQMNGYTGSQSDAMVSAAAKLDSRDVTISAVNVDATYYKGPPANTDSGSSVDANGDPIYARTQHTPDPDGTMKGDIGLDFADQTLNIVDDARYQRVTYHANRIGGWLPYDSQDWWNSSLKNYSSNEYLNIGACNISDFTNLYKKPLDLSPEGSPPGTVIDFGDAKPSINPDHIHLTYQDGDQAIPVDPYSHPQSDQATATANYYMTVHLADEILTSNKPPEEIFYDASSNSQQPDMQFKVDGMGYALSGGGGVNCTWDPPGALWQYASDAFTVLSHGPWSEDVPWLGMALAVVGIGIDKLAPQAKSQNVSFDYSAWDSSYATFQGYPDPITGATRPPLTKDYPSTPSHALDDELVKWDMIPHMRVVYTRKYILKDHYDTTGFTAETLIPFDIYTGQEQFYGEFVRADRNSKP